MPSVIELEHLTKAFGDVVAVDDIELAIARGEIVCLLGPSGCGKTTTLRMVAGFDRPTKGEIRIAGVVVSSGSTLIPPERRNLGMVFQNYAVWPHMTVFRNIAYPLRIKRVPHREIQKKVDEAIQLTGLAGLAKRYPEQLSGGQQQRVALARALVVQPVAMLLDEPLSNLDAKLREKMRFELMDLHRRTGITVVYVTHDQAEAMVLSDRIVVMNEGRIDQIGSPGEIYRQPRSAFVADFIGLANFARATLVECSGAQGRAVVAGVEDISFPCEVPVDTPPSGEGLLFVRPEDIRLTEEAGGTPRGIVRRRTFLGNQVDYRIEAVGKEWRVEVNPDVTIPEGSAVGMSVQRAVFLPETPAEGAS